MNDGEDLAESVDIYLFFSPEFEVHENIYYQVTTQRPGSEHPSCKAAIYHLDMIHINVSNILTTSVTMPERAGIYPIPVTIYERKIGEYKDELVIEVVQ